MAWELPQTEPKAFSPWDESAVTDIVPVQGTYELSLEFACQDAEAPCKDGLALKKAPIHEGAGLQNAEMWAVVGTCGIGKVLLGDVFRISFDDVYACTGNVLLARRDQQLLLCRRAPYSQMVNFTTEIAEDQLGYQSNWAVPLAHEQACMDTIAGCLQFMLVAAPSLISHPALRHASTNISSTTLPLWQMACPRTMLWACQSAASMWDKVLGCKMAARLFAKTGMVLDQGHEQSGFLRFPALSDSSETALPGLDTPCSPPMCLEVSKLALEAGTANPMLSKGPTACRSTAVATLPNAGAAWPYASNFELAMGSMSSVEPQSRERSGASSKQCDLTVTWKPPKLSRPLALTGKGPDRDSKQLALLDAKPENSKQLALLDAEPEHSKQQLALMDTEPDEESAPVEDANLRVLVRKPTCEKTVSRPVRRQSRKTFCPGGTKTQQADVPCPTFRLDAEDVPCPTFRMDSSDGTCAAIAADADAEMEQTRTDGCDSSFAMSFKALDVDWSSPKATPLQLPPLRLSTLKTASPPSKPRRLSRHRSALAFASATSWDLECKPENHPPMRESDASTCKGSSLADACQASPPTRKQLMSKTKSFSRLQSALSAAALSDSESCSKSVPLASCSKLPPLGVLSPLVDAAATWSMPMSRVSEPCVAW